MNPYYDHNGITIYHGNNSDIDIPFVDHIITDPPYSQRTHDIDGIHACGSGEPYALVAMHALDGLPPETRILKALAITGSLSVSVGGPYYVMKY